MITTPFPQAVTLQNIFLKYSSGFRSQTKIPYSAHKVLNAVERCHTSQLGAHVIRCQTPSCSYEKIAYNSCRNRHCPACQGSQSARWVSEREAELLPVPYFHICFTLPHELNPLILMNKKLLYDILFSSAWESVSELIHSSKAFGGQGGAIGVLHTWGQNLMDHPHVHMIVPGGALLQQNAVFNQRPVRRQKDGVKVRDFLVPVGPLRILYKNKFISQLAHLYKTGQLVFHGEMQRFADADSFYKMKDQVFAKNWVVYCKEPFAGPKQVLAYLGRYTHRVALSNSRLVSMNENKVTFKLKNYRKDGKKELMVLPAYEFIRRFLLHVLPKGYRRIRMYGFLANRYKQKNLEKIRTYLQVPQVVVEKKKKASVAEVILHSTGVNILLCPKCKKVSLILIHQGGRGSG